MTTTPLTSTYVIFLSLYWNAFALHGQMDSLTMHVAGHFPIIVMLQLNKKSIGESVISADDIFIVSTQQLRKKAETYFPGNSLIRAPTITRCQQREKTIRQIYCRFRTRRPPDYYPHTFFLFKVEENGTRTDLFMGVSFLGIYFFLCSQVLFY